MHLCSLGIQDIFRKENKKADRRVQRRDEEQSLSNFGELEKGFSARLDIKKLKGTRNHYRIRVGNYRILLVIESEMAYVYDISHRESVYK